MSFFAMPQVARRIVFCFLVRPTLVHGTVLHGEVQHQQNALRGGPLGVPVLDKDLAVSSPQTCVPLKNWGSFSTVEISVGTPEQFFSVVADTGSDNVIIPSCLCQEMHRCYEKDRCFHGTGNSSTFFVDDAGPDGPPGAVITFGSGAIQVVITTDLVRVGKVSKTMDDGVLLMVDQQLDFGGPFEGIIGLGLPSTEADSDATLSKTTGSSSATQIRATVGMHDEDIGLISIEHLPEATLSSTGGSTAATKIRATVGVPEEDIGLISIRNLPDNNSTNSVEERNSEVSDTRGFLERAGVNRFSMCFNDGSDGALRLNPPEPPRTLGNIGREHWAVDFRGMTVGNNTKSVGFCGDADMQTGQETPCAGIPDSGTTAIMGPAGHIDMLFESLCDGWDRCVQNHTAMVAGTREAHKALEGTYGVDPYDLKPSPKADIFQFLLLDCDHWMESSEHGLDEIPPIHLNLRGADGSEQILEMPAWSYVTSQEVQFDPDNADAVKQMCQPVFSPMEYLTELNGPIWIFGTAFFYLFEVGYDLKASPPGISFTSINESSPCGSCSEGHTSQGVPASLVSDSTGSLSATAPKQKHRQPRRTKGPNRRSSIDTSRPL